VGRWVEGGRHGQDDRQCSQHVPHKVGCRRDDVCCLGFCRWRQSTPPTPHPCRTPATHQATNQPPTHPASQPATQLPPMHLGCCHPSLQKGPHRRLPWLALRCEAAPAGASAGRLTRPCSCSNVREGTSQGSMSEVGRRSVIYRRSKARRLQGVASRKLENTAWNTWTAWNT